MGWAEVWRETRPTSLLGSWEGTRQLGGSGRCGDSGDCTVWAPHLGCGVFIPTVHPWQGLTPPSPQQVLPPHWQLWRVLVTKGTAIAVLSGYRHTELLEGLTSTHSCPLPLLSESKSLLPTSIPWSPVQPRQWPAPLCPRRARWSLLVSPLHGGSASSQGDTVPPFPSLQRSPRHFTRCSRWWR